MKPNYISLVAESKAAFHKKRAKMTFEKKFKIIIELQKIEIEMIKNNKNRKSDQKLRRVWQFDDQG